MNPIIESTCGLGGGFKKKKKKKKKKERKRIESGKNNILDIWGWIMAISLAGNREELSDKKSTGLEI